MILVTGGTGLVGSHLLYHLLMEHDTVKAIHQQNSNLEAVKKVFSYYTSEFIDVFDRIIWIRASLNDVESLQYAFRKVTHVYHCAALVLFDPSEYQKMHRINVEGTANIVNLSITNSVKKLCFVSSVAAVEKNKTSLIDESGTWVDSKLKSGYARTKHNAELEVWRAAREGVEVIIINPGIILGSGFWDRGTGKIFSRIYEWLNFYTERVTCLVSVKDVARIMIKLTQSKIKNERFILVSENFSFKDLYFQTADALHKKRPRYKLSPVLSEIIWRLEFIKSKITGKTGLIDRRTAKTVLSKQYYTSKKVKTALDFKFEKIEESIKDICRDFLK